jgi:hypothetical protein
MSSEKRKITVDPKEALFEGVKIIGPLMASNGFTFHFRDEGSGSGGKFAWGEFVRKDRRLELHFRHSLGLVRYHVRKANASHEAYMRELGVWAQCRYPGFSDNPMDAFHNLAHDLQFAGDFLSGRGESVRDGENRREQSQGRTHGCLGGRHAQTGRTEKLLSAGPLR